MAIGIFLAGCGTMQLDERFGRPDPARHDRPSGVVPGAPDYWREVRPILDQRCVACHACYDAPCQLNLTSHAGLARGANPTPVYSSSRLRPDAPTRLGVDAQSAAEWRRQGFFPVLNEREPTAEANREASVIHRLLLLKQQHPGPTSGRLVDKDIDLALDRRQTCVAAEGVADYARKHPGRGMPFALPALAATEHETLARWLTAGAPYVPPPPLPAALQAQVADWERFLNGDSLKEQLVARYIYEHWYVGRFRFAAAPDIHFEWVRSRTPPGQPVDLVVGRRPYDDPGSQRVYYRLRRDEATPVAKTFMPLTLDAARMERIRGWFLRPAYEVSKLPDYTPELAANPFVTFAALPADSRYRFMLDDAQFMLMGFIKGPVCRGQVALNVISDHFWVMFVSPDSPAFTQSQQLLAGEAPNLQLPAAEESSASMLAWGKYASLERRHLANKAKAMSALPPTAGAGLDSLWDGGGSNRNAALTVFRHFDSATVVQGLAGSRPQTMLVLGYPLFERMHYLLLTGFDVYGNVGHQLLTRLYMDFLRMEGELNFVALLPPDKRQAVLDRWYRGAGVQHEEFLQQMARGLPPQSRVSYSTADPLGELYAVLGRRMAWIAPTPPAADYLNRQESALRDRLSSVKGVIATVMPEHSVVILQRPDGGVRLLSLVRNSAHSNIAHLINEDKRRLPAEDELLALQGVVGAYPNALFVVPPGELSAFAEAVQGLQGDADLERLVGRFGVRRTDPRFWELSDTLHREWRRMQPEDAAMLDYSRLENL